MSYSRLVLSRLEDDPGPELGAQWTVDLFGRAMLEVMKRPSF